MKPRDLVRRNYLPSSYKAFLSVGCQFGASTDTIFEKKYPLDFKPNSDFVRQNHDVFVIQNKEKSLIQPHRNKVL